MRNLLIQIYFEEKGVKMGWLFPSKKTVKGQKQSDLSLPPLMPDNTMRPRFNSSLRSEVEHVSAGSSIPEPPFSEQELDMKMSKALPDFPELSEAEPKTKTEIPAFPELPEMSEYNAEYNTEDAPKKLPEFPDIKSVPAEERLFEEESEYEVRKEVEGLKGHVSVKPVFVEVERFKDMLDDLNQTKISLKEAVDIMAKLDEIRLDKDKLFEEWKSQLEDIQRKLIFVDRTLFEIKYV
jgi:hypothetical protein